MTDTRHLPLLETFRQPEGFYALPAPAKLNLTLRIVGRRSDGYHLLQSVFTLIGLCDTVDILPRGDGKIILQNPLADTPAEKDLTVRAARALHDACPQSRRYGAVLRLHKKIPVGGGLGGGSSDAATVLLFLNHIWQCGFSRAQLMEIGLTLGADVPFFLYGKPAFVEGIGEKMNPVDIPEEYYVIVRPPVSVSTAEIFADPGLTRDSAECIIRSLEKNVVRRNDLANTVFGRYPVIGKYAELLEPYGEVYLSGSGSCIFLPFGTADRAQQVFREIRHSHEAYCAAGLTVHPLRSLSTDGESSSG